VLAATRSVVEGVETARSLHARARELGVETPIIDAVHRVLFEGQSPAAALRDLMGRAAGNERID
jgi:glycerol-3-phosphate dehydrogenase (NAD(P)+)